MTGSRPKIPLGSSSLAIFAGPTPGRLFTIGGAHARYPFGTHLFGRSAHLVIDVACQIAAPLIEEFGTWDDAAG